MPKRSYEAGLLERLRDLDYALAYLDRSEDDSEMAFLMAMDDVYNASKLGPTNSEYDRLIDMIIKVKTQVFGMTRGVDLCPNA